MPLPRLKSPAVRSPRRSIAAAWVNLEQQLEAIPGTWCQGELLNLPGWKTIKYRETNHDIVVLAELTTEVTLPCACNVPAPELIRYGFTTPCYILDLPIRCKRVRIYYRSQRLRCPKCRKTGQQPVRGIDEKHKITTRLVEYIEQESFDLFRNFSGVADEVGCSEQTVRNIFTRRAVQLEMEEKLARKEGRYEPPEWLAIDEVYPQKKESKSCVITAPARQQVLEILPVDEEKELFRWLLQLPKPHLVKVVSIDMWPEYRKVVRRLLPQAIIVVDRYHVHNLLNVALKQVLDVMRANMTYTENREHMRPEHLLLTSYRNLSNEPKRDENGRIVQPSHKELADKWLADMPDIARAHRLKEEFSDILQLTDREKAEAKTELWLQQVCDFVDYFRAKYKNNHPGTWPDPFGNVPHTITDWRDSILNYIDCKNKFGIRTITNSFAEFANGRIKQAYKVGHHYSDEVLRIKVKHGGVLIRRRPPHPLDKPQLRIINKSAKRRGKKTGQEINPKANLEVLKQQRVEADETRGLLPKPQDHPGWANRFNAEEMARVRQKAAEQEPPAEITQAPVTDEDMQQPRTEKGSVQRRIKYDPNQGNLF